MIFPQHVKDLALALFKGDESAREPLFDSLAELDTGKDSVLHRHLLDKVYACRGHATSGCFVLGIIFGDGDFDDSNGSNPVMTFTDDMQEKAKAYLRSVGEEYDW